MPWPEPWPHWWTATPVITTATDVQGLPAIDTMAAGLGLAIENLAMVKHIQMAWLRGQRVRIVDPAGFLQAELAGFPDLSRFGRSSRNF